jgi:hypothetical protein
MPNLTFPSPPRRDAIDRAAAGAAGAALTTDQVRRLILAALAAHREQRRCGLAEDGDFDAFRHAAAWEICGVASFRALQQRHYNAVLGRFRALAGDSRGAGRVAARSCGDGERRAMAKLRLECAALADAWGGDSAAAMAYAERCSMAINKSPLAQASERGIWRAMFTLRRRAGQLRRKTAPPGQRSSVPAAPESPARALREKTPIDQAHERNAASQGFAGGARASGATGLILFYRGRVVQS